MFPSALLSRAFCFMRKIDVLRSIDQVIPVSIRVVLATSILAVGCTRSRVSDDVLVLPTQDVSAGVAAFRTQAAETLIAEPTFTPTYLAGIVNTLEAIQTQSVLVGEEIDARVNQGIRDAFATQTAAAPTITLTPTETQV